jgi:hypothetical protein
LKPFDGLTILYNTYTKKRSSKALSRSRKIGKKTDHHLQSGGLIPVAKNFSENHPAGRSQAFWEVVECVREGFLSLFSKTVFDDWFPRFFGDDVQPQKPQNQ